VNSLGLTEQQPENNVYRILLEMLAVVLSKDARARAVQLPAWNEALGLPRPWDQQWSIRLQQILAEETDLLEYDDLFNGSAVVAAKVEELKAGAREELARIAAQGGAIAAVESGYMKQRLVESNARRVAAIESGEQAVVGVNRHTDSAPSPLAAGADGGFLAIDERAEAEQIDNLRAWRAARDSAKVKAALAELSAAAAEGRNIMPPSIACAHAGVTTGEWGEALRRSFGEYRAPTGIALAAAPARSNSLAELREQVDQVSARVGRRLKILVGKPGLDGHSNGAEQVAMRARDCGFEVVYPGIRLTPAEIADAALKEGVHVVGLSILSGSHVVLVEEVLRRLRALGLARIPVIVGGIIPPEDERRLIAAGVARVYTPKDYDLTQIMRDVVGVVDRAHERAA
jgi:(2R)-ethylmalonyl-CoA mutase